MNELSIEEIQLLEQKFIDKARDNFFVYRQYINPTLKYSDWQKDASYELMKFWEKFKQGLRPKLAIEAPPQHGKSQMVIDFISWVAGKDPSKKTIYTSYSERLGIRANLRLQRVFDSYKYKKVFPETKINAQNTVTISGQYLRNREILEYVDNEGYFYNCTVGSSITGLSLDLAVCDDLVKGIEQAQSVANKQKLEDWIDDDLRTRFSDDAGWLIIGTRWMIDDAIGHIRKNFKDIKVLTYKAIADEDEKFRKAGEPLFPTHKSLEFLMEQKSTRSALSWLALYQQNPTLASGNLFKKESFKYFTYEDGHIITDKSLLYDNYRIYQIIDPAGTEGKKSDYFVCMTIGVNMHNRDIIILDLYREKSETTKHMEILNNQYVKWKPIIQYVENRSFGINIIQAYAQTNRPVMPLTADKSKTLRSELIQVFYQNGKVFHRSGVEWTSTLEEELLSFPFGNHDDIVDCLSYAGIIVQSLEFVDNRIVSSRKMR